jgi:hypothetical protein
MAGQGAEASPEEAASWHTWSVDINGDGNKELFVSNVPGWCGSGGCSVWLWQRTPQGLRNLLHTAELLTLAVELGETGLDGYRDILFYHRAMQSSAKQSLAQERLQWDGQSYQIHAKTFLGDYLHTPIPEGAWRVIK